MKKEEKKDYLEPELVEYENLNEVTKGDFSDPDS
jgi:hypothetical protein